MSHQMTQLDAENALYKERPWHGLGNIGHIEWTDARDAFDWCEVERTPIFIEHHGVEELLEGRNVLKMVNYPFAHAEVSARYKIVQHRFMADDLTGILLDTGLVETIESVGTYDNGAIGYVSLKFKDGIKIPGWSHVHSMFNIGNGHDKMVPLIATQSAQAVVCANTFKWNILDKAAIFRFRKIGEPQAMMEEAVHALCDSYERNVEYAKMIERMANETFVNTEWDALRRQLIGDAPKWNGIEETRAGWMNAHTRWETKKNQINDRYYVDPDLSGVYDTKWGALMAVQAWEQKDKSMKGLKSQSQRQQRHQAAVMFGKLPVTEKAAKILTGVSE